MSAPDSLFAAKGQAQPVDQTRDTIDMSAEPETTKPRAADAETKPLPDLFGEPANDETTEALTASDDKAPGAGDAEPPPAASLLTIVSQRSAAKRRPASPGTPDATPQEALAETDDNAAAPFPEAANADDELDAETRTTNLPVPVQIQLPMLTGSPVAGKSRWDRRMAALAACVAISLAGAITILIAGSAEDTVATVNDIIPPDTGGTKPAVTNSAETAPAHAADTPINATADVPIAPPRATASEPPKTRIDTVRIDIKGQAIVSGRAPPEAELIVLHNRRPLGTARSDAAGIWTFSARLPTRTNRNEISVVPMRIDNSVMVTDLPAVPRPGRRPTIPSYYFAQIASLPSAADAGREAAKLAAKLTGIITAHQISVRVATIENGRKVYRVAIGGFSTKAGATNTCDRIRAKGTSCLVMRGS